MIPAGARQGVCKGGSCYAPIYWVKTPNGKYQPMNHDGTPHHATCPDAPEFKAKAKLAARLAEIQTKGW